MKIYTVQECSALVSSVFQKDYSFKNITVRGTISNLSVHFSGIRFFSLIDENLRIYCKIGKMRSSFLGRNLLNGTEASVIGDLRFDKSRGTPVLYVERIISVKESALTLSNELLEAELDKKGYFAVSHKKKLPEFPFHIGIITSGSGAVIYDILKTGNKRNNSVSYSLYTSFVQGAGAAADMANMIDIANQERNPPDVLIIARGGGAEEDLQTFNEEVLLNTVFRSKIPIISAVGHENDYTLLDRVADVRASTPTQAVEIAVPEKKYILEKIFSQITFSEKCIKKYMADRRFHLIFTLKDLNYLSDTDIFFKGRRKVFLQWLLLQGMLKNKINHKAFEVMEQLLLLNDTKQ